MNVNIFGATGMAGQTVLTIGRTPTGQHRRGVPVMASVYPSLNPKRLIPSERFLRNQWFTTARLLQTLRVTLNPMQQQILSETIRVIGPMGDCGTDRQGTKINHIGEIGSSRYAFREAFGTDLYNWKRN